MPRERPILGVQSMPLNPSSDTFIDAYVPHLGRSWNTMPRIDTGSCNSSVPYDPDWYYTRLGPYVGAWSRMTHIGINMCKPSHLSAETVLTPSHLFAETVLGTSHLLAETVFSASHLFTEMVFSASHLFAETVLSMSPLFAETYQ
ncbi:hypothetical protein BS47DRAFT_1401747 [Hydnum rufescens UP504]|uniref:Uncharacterized protein n=1 Tax=Hydnum rufescens UP504 TaxID=1448309 RepID=A0A9P6AFS0_9AGAM|nr:hypothetical protein BS47DRAFT_1401747 [Hydnum rufescens UP504]